MKLVSEQTKVKQASKIFFRVLSIYIFLSSVATGAYWLFASDQPTRIASALIMTLALVISISGWRLAPRLSDRLLKIDEQVFDTRGIAVLALRVVGLYVVLTGISQTILQLAGVAISESSPVWTPIFPALHIFSGLLVWLYSEKLGTRLASDSRAVKGSPAIVVINAELQALALSVLGVFVLIYVIPDIVSLGTISYFYPSDNLANGEWIISGVSKLVISVVLIYGARSFSQVAPRDYDHGLDLSEEV